MENVVYMPIHWGMSEADIKTTVDRTIECYNRLVNYLRQQDIPRPKNPRNLELLIEGPKL
jgi:hypothetical protein